jgi:hypothetical protein
VIEDVAVGVPSVLREAVGVAEWSHIVMVAVRDTAVVLGVALIGRIVACTVGEAVPVRVSLPEREELRVAAGEDVAEVVKESVPVDVARAVPDGEGAPVGVPEVVDVGDGTLVGECSHIVGVGVLDAVTVAVMTAEAAADAVDASDGVAEGVNEQGGAGLQLVGALHTPVELPPAL